MENNPTIKVLEVKGKPSDEFLKQLLTDPAAIFEGANKEQSDNEKGDNEKSFGERKRADAKLTAELSKILYDALISEGFDHADAITLTAAIMS